MKKSRSKFLKIVDEKHDINFHWPNNILNNRRFKVSKFEHFLYTNNSLSVVVQQPVLYTTNRFKSNS